MEYLKKVESGAVSRENERDQQHHIQIQIVRCNGEHRLQLGIYISVALVQIASSFKD